MHGTFIEYSWGCWLKSTFIGEIFLEDFQKKGKTSTLHLDINKLEYIEDAVNHLQNTGVGAEGYVFVKVFFFSFFLRHLFSTCNVLGVILRINPAKEAGGPTCVAGCVFSARLELLIGSQSNKCKAPYQRGRHSLSGWIDLEFPSSKYPFVTNKINK